MPTKVERGATYTAVAKLLQPGVIVAGPQTQLLPLIPDQH
jgi:hypothetical protein